MVFCKGSIVCIFDITILRKLSKHLLYIHPLFGLLIIGLVIIDSCALKSTKQQSEQFKFTQVLKSIGFEYKDSLSQLLNNLDTTQFDRSEWKEYYLLRAAEYRLDSDLKQSIQYNQLAGQLISEPYSEVDAEIYFLNGQLFTSSHELDVAYKNFVEALKIYKALGDDLGQGKCYSSIAFIFYRINDLEKATSYNKKGQDLLVNCKPLTGYASSLTIEGYILAAQGFFEEAINKLDQSTHIYKQVNDSVRYVNSYLNKGEVLMQRGDLKQAEKDFKFALESSTNLEYKQIHIDAYNKLGQCYIEKGDFELALKTLMTGLEKANYLEEKPLINEFCQNIAECYFKTGTYELAYDYQKKHQELNAAFSEEERNLRLAQYETEFKTAAIAEENERLVRKNQKIKTYGIVLLVTFLFVGILVFFFYHRQKARLQILEQQKQIDEVFIKNQKLQHDKLLADKRLEAEINEKLSAENEFNKQLLTSITLNLYQKNDNLMKFLKDLEEISTIQDTKTKEALRKLKRSIQSNINLDEDWQNFKIHFDQVYQGFMKKLSTNYPVLTPLDLRHCAYIKMNLTTKEISRMMNINPASVQKSRVRLKRKLKLDRSIDLYSFINNY